MTKKVFPEIDSARQSEVGAKDCSLDRGMSEDELDMIVGGGMSLVIPKRMGSGFHIGEAAADLEQESDVEFPNEPSRLSLAIEGERGESSSEPVMRRDCSPPELEEATSEWGGAQTIGDQAAQINNLLYRQKELAIRAGNDVGTAEERAEWDDEYARISDRIEELASSN